MANQSTQAETTTVVSVAERVTNSAVEASVYTVFYLPTEEPETLSLYCTACNFMGPLSSVSIN